VHVCVDADVLQALEGQNQHEVRRLPSDAGQRQQLFHRAGHAAAVPLDEKAARFLDVPGLVPIEAHRINQALNPCGRQLRHRPWRARDAEQACRCGGRHRIPRLRRQHRRNEDLEGVLLTFLRDLFDRRELEMVDGARQGTHYGENGLRRRFSHRFGYYSRRPLK